MMINGVILVIILGNLSYLTFILIKQIRLLNLKRRVADQPLTLKKIGIYQDQLIRKHMFSLIVVNLLMSIALVLCVYMNFEIQNTRINDHKMTVDLLERIKELTDT
ncbi:MULTISPECIES: hypothetical protein [unclassified Enterococcus]|uniref:hypothetical protein n=1 Tax=unclassified Enterococcus TaxID=2608891 RepID=UPI001A9B731F|nr:hypothetical protein [Enterococcus sp. DIV1271a]MBO1299615.1 hypothetical protein [Enterococcus sp. DIV1271a]